MAEPAKKLDDQDESRNLSALERAHQSWGMAPTTPDPDDLEGAEKSAGEDSSTLDRAREKWGSADVVDGDNDNKEEPSLYRGDGEDNKSEVERGEDSESDIPYNPDGEQKRTIKSRIVTRRNGIIGGSVAAAGLGGFALFSVASGPMQLVHLSQFLSLTHFTSNEEFNNDRSARRMYNLVKGQTERSNLGAINNKLADKLEVKLNEKNGLKSVYHPVTGRFKEFEVLDKEKASKLLADMKDEGFDIDTRDGKQFVNLEGASFKDRRKLVKAFVQGADIDGVAGKLSSRLLIKRGGVSFHPLTGAKRKATDSVIKFYEDMKKKRNEEIRNGVNEDIVNAPEAEQTDTDGNGEPDGVNPEADEGKKAAQELLGEGEAVDIDSPEAVRLLKSKLLTRLGGSVAAVVGAACMMKDLGNSAEKLQYTQTILPMIRTSMMFISVGSQIQSGQDVSLDELGTLTADLYDESDDGNPNTHPSSAFASQPMQAARGEELTGSDIPDHLKPGEIGEKPAFFAALDEIPALGTACGISNFISGLPVIKQFGDLTSSAIGAVIPIDAFVNGVVGWLAGRGMDYAATGSDLGGILMYGGRLAANNQAAASGGLEMSGTEEIALAEYNQELVDYDFVKKSFFARIFDAYDARSVVSRLAMSLPRSTGGLVSFITSAPSKISSALTPRAMAATNYDYGFNKVGFSVDEMNDSSISDPYENAAIVEPQLAALNEQYGKKCFNLSVELVGTEGVKVVNGDQSYQPFEHKDDLEACNSSNDPMLLRYRAYLADAVGTQAEVCYEGVSEEACSELGFGAQSSISGPPLSAPGLNGYTIPCTGEPRQVVKRNQSTNGPSADWTGIPDSGTIGTNSGGQPIKVYIREACDTANAKTIVIVSSIHGSENDGQFVSHELLFNKDLPDNLRIVAIPELNGTAINPPTRRNANGVDLNRNFDYRWDELTSSLETTPGGFFYKGAYPGSEPETQAIVNFLPSLGEVALFLVYHDNLNYVAPVGNTPLTLANMYGGVAGMKVGNALGTWVNQRGSMDGWYNQVTGHPTLLVETSGTVVQSVIDRHVNALITAATGAANLQ